MHGIYQTRLFIVKARWCTNGGGTANEHKMAVLKSKYHELESELKLSWHDKTGLAGNRK